MPPSPPPTPHPRGRTEALSSVRPRQVGMSADAQQGRVSVGLGEPRMVAAAAVGVGAGRAREASGGLVYLWCPCSLRAGVSPCTPVLPRVPLGGWGRGVLALLSLGHRLRASTGVQGQCCGDLGEAGAPRDSPPRPPLVPQGREDLSAGSEPLSLLVVLWGW